MGCLGLWINEISRWESIREDKMARMWIRQYRMVWTSMSIRNIEVKKGQKHVWQHKHDKTPWYTNSLVLLTLWRGTTTRQKKLNLITKQCNFPSTAVTLLHMHSVNECANLHPFTLDVLLHWKCTSNCLNTCHTGITSSLHCLQQMTRPAPWPVSLCQRYYRKHVAVGFWLLRGRDRSLEAKP